MGTFSKGLWRDAYIAVILPGAAAILHVAPLVFYEGAYPEAPLVDAAAAGPWLVSVRVLLLAPPSGAAATGTLSVSGSWGGGAASKMIDLPPGAETLVVVNVSVPAGVELWWPNGLGQQALYIVNATWTPAVPAAAAVSSARTLGFRVVAIVTGDDTNPANLTGKDGSGDLVVRWKVNGANIVLRGADVIPMEAAEGRQSDVAYRGMLASAAAAHMNVVRVDGIDLYFPDVFYDTCDELGLLVYHDLQYSQGNVAPANTTTQTAELIHSARRLAHHPSVAVYDGCNGA